MILEATLKKFRLEKKFKFKLILKFEKNWLFKLWFINFSFTFLFSFFRKNLFIIWKFWFFIIVINVNDVFLNLNIANEFSNFFYFESHDDEILIKINTISSTTKIIQSCLFSNWIFVLHFWFSILDSVK